MAYQCPDCNFGYVPGHEEDEKDHRAFHDEAVNGVHGQPIKSDHVVWQDNDSRITVVTAHSSKPQRIRAARAASVANREMHYNGGTYCEYESPDQRDIHLFLYYRRNRMIGLLITERRYEAWRCTWTEWERGEAQKLIGHPDIWSVGFVWVHSKHRRIGIASTLFHQAIAHLGQSKELVGWYTPFSDEGERLVKSLYPSRFLIGK